LLSTVFLAEIIDFQIGIGTSLIFLGLVLVSASTPEAVKIDFKNYKEHRVGYFYGLLSGFFFGVSYICTRVSVVVIGSPVITSLIGYLSSILFIMVVLLFSQKREKFKLRRLSKIYLFGAGIMRVFGAYSRTIAYSMAPVVLVTPMVSVGPLVTVFISYLLIQKIELVNQKVVLGAVFVVVGTILISIFR
jgi:drug/metabolite transporter (DMT)-like permease